MKPAELLFSLQSIRKEISEGVTNDWRKKKTREGQRKKKEKE